MASGFGDQTIVLLDPSKPQMPIEVYIWTSRFKDQALGHASMSLSDGTYISWWPRGGDERKSVKGKPVKAPPVHDRSLTDDIQGEGGRLPDVTRIIPGGYIVEEFIRNWWEPFSEEEYWKLFGQNCSTVVYKALCEGWALQYFQDDEKRYYESVLIWSPSKVDQFVQRLIECVSSRPKPKVFQYFK